jgi:hypothetical protein
MTQGFLIHAYNNTELDYGTMALCSALLIKKHLRINSVSLATTDDTIKWISDNHGADLIAQAFDHITVVDIDRDASVRTYHDTRYSSKIQPYYNGNRSDSFDLSPFDETILIDADYLILDDSLDNAWNSVEDLMVNKSIRDLRHAMNIGGFDQRFNEMSIPLYWATVMYFKRNNRIKAVFETMKFIKENYGYYQDLYRFSPSGYFRNDYALSIALHMISGQFENDAITPLPLSEIVVATENDDMIGFKNGHAFFVSETVQGDFKLHQVRNNVHVMNKWSIGRMAPRIIEYATN